LTEKTAVKIGASDMNGTGALETTNFTYAYGSITSTGLTSGEQLLKTSTQDSVLSSGNKTTVTQVYDSTNNRLKATIQSGYTESTLGAAPSLVYIGTFLYAARCTTWSSGLCTAW